MSKRNAPSFPRPDPTDPARAHPRARLGSVLRWSAWALLLLCLAGRTVSGELPYRLSAVQVNLALAAGAGDSRAIAAVDWTDSARAIHAVLILLGVVLWAGGSALAGKVLLPGRWFLVAMGVWLIAGVWSSAGASDGRSAWLVYLEQAALLGGACAAVDLARHPRRLVLLAAVLAALGVVVAAKGMMQGFGENRDLVEQFESDREGYLESMGLRPGEPRARMQEDRILDTSWKGYFGLANLTASNLLVLLFPSVGLFAAKIITWRRRRREDGPMPRGEVRPSAVAMALSGLLLLPAGMCLVGTRSRGGFFAALVVLVGWLIVWPMRGFLRRHWRWVVGIGCILFLLLVVGVAAWGVAHGRLPGKTMAVRWLYWRGSAEIITDRPAIGVGGGNFPAAYLQVRTPEGDEGVRTPHNVFAHAWVQFGLVGGTAWLGVVLAGLIGAIRPSSQEPMQGGDSSAGRYVPWGIIAGCALAVTAARWGLYAWPGHWQGAMIILDCLLPGGLFAVAAVAWFWFGSNQPLGASSISVLRLGLLLGALGFCVHNLVTYSFWAPGVAWGAWLALAGAMGRSPGWTVRLGRPMRWTLVTLPVAGLMAGMIFVAGPIVRRQAVSMELTRALLQRHLASAPRLAAQAAEADPQDPLSARTAAEVYHALAMMEPDRIRRRQMLEEALAWMRESIRRHPADAGGYRQAGQIATVIHAMGFADESVPPAADWLAQAVERDPSDARLRLEYAAALLRAGLAGEALRELDEADRIDKALGAFDPTSTWRLGEREKRAIGELSRQARSKLEDATSSRRDESSAPAQNPTEPG